MIFRNDDICANSNIDDVTDIYNVIRDQFPESSFLSGVTVFSRHSEDGAVYPHSPFKDNPVNWFYNINHVMRGVFRVPGEIASHGLFHIDHSSVSRGTQEMSIVSSCNYLQSKTFIPPFNRYNSDTESICADNGITLVKKEGWKSLEFEPFDPAHDKWYFHSWRWTSKKMMEALSANSVNVG